LTHNILIFESVLLWKLPNYSKEDFSYTVTVQSRCWSVDQT